MTATDNLLRIIDAAVVTPSDPSLPPRSLPFTFFDVEWLRPRPIPVQRVFFYRLTSTQHHHHGTAHQLISDLKHSLSKALALFYPLAGHVRLTPGARTSNRYELFYQPGDGVAFTAAEYDRHVDDCLDDDPGLPVSIFAPLVPLLPKGRAVLAVQATVLRGGLALGVTVHHSACDGASSTHFLHTWAAACADTDMPPPPVIDRTLIADPDNLYDVYYKGMSLPSDGGEIEFTGSTASSYPEDRLVATFTMSQELIQRIKDAITVEAARQDDPTPFRCSSLLAAYSFIWSCYFRAKQSLQNPMPMDDGGQERARTYFLFAVDHRKRLNPPVPERYMGNYLSPAIAAAYQDELAGETTGGLFAAFTAITGALKEAVGESSQERWERCMKRLSVAAKAGMLSVAGSPRFHVYDVDFGFGRPARVHMVSAARTGSVSVSDPRDGRGGLDFGVPLPAGGMERFRRCFADACRDVGCVQESDKLSSYY
uniref:Uncharacterized protein n=1 Tax=Avena sativa TaxID=4498 RepID=A0ACD5Y702_AVESA